MQPRWRIWARSRANFLGRSRAVGRLPQSPELRRPDRFPDAARAARNRVLDRVAAAGVVPPDEIARADLNRAHARKQLPMLAPHAADRVVSLEPDRRVHRLTIELPLQKTLQGLALERAQGLDPISRSPFLRWTIQAVR